MRSAIYCWWSGDERAGIGDRALGASVRVIQRLGSLCARGISGQQPGKPLYPRSNATAFPGGCVKDNSSLFTSPSAAKSVQEARSNYRRSGAWNGLGRIAYYSCEDEVRRLCNDLCRIQSCSDWYFLAVL